MRRAQAPAADSFGEWGRWLLARQLANKYTALNLASDPHLCPLYRPFFELMGRLYEWIFPPSVCCVGRPVPAAPLCIFLGQGRPPLSWRCYNWASGRPQYEGPVNMCHSPFRATNAHARSRNTTHCNTMATLMSALRLSCCTPPWSAQCHAPTDCLASVKPSALWQLLVHLQLWAGAGASSEQSACVLRTLCTPP